MSFGLRDAAGSARVSGANATYPRYAGGYLTSAGLYHYGQRYYDPTDARWTQPDPLNQPADVRQANKYTYAGADPINAVDPDGRSLCLIIKECRERVLKPAARKAAPVIVKVYRKAPGVCFVISSTRSGDRNDFLGDDIQDLAECALALPDSD